MFNYLYIFGTIVCTVYGQIVLKWRISQYGFIPFNFQAKLKFIAILLQDPFVISGFAAAFLASIFWMLAMTKFQLSYAYPFTSLSFVLVLLLGNVFFHEPITFNKALGLAIISLGIFIGSQG